MNEEVQRIEMTIEQAESKIAKAQKAEQLLGNPIFKELITEGYLGDDAVRLVMNLKPGKDNETTDALLNGKAVFSRYIANVLAEGAMAQATLDEHREMLREVEKD